MIIGGFSENVLQDVQKF